MNQGILITIINSEELNSKLPPINEILTVNKAALAHVLDSVDLSTEPARAQVCFTWGIVETLYTALVSSEPAPTGAEEAARAIASCLPRDRITDCLWEIVKIGACGYG